MKKREEENDTFKMRINKVKHEETFSNQPYIVIQTIYSSYETRGLMYEYTRVAYNTI